MYRKWQTLRKKKNNYFNISAFYLYYMKYLPVPPTFLWLFSFLLFTPTLVKAEVKQDTTTLPETRMTLSYLYSSNDTITLSAGIMVKRETGPTYLANILIDFTAFAGPETRIIGSVKTDESGAAVLKYPIKKGIPADKDGITTYVATFKGIGKYLAAEEKISAKLAKITIKFSTQDSLRNIDVTAIETGSNNDQKPIAKQTILLYVPRLFSLLKIGEVSLDEEGKGSLEFPRHIIGDSLGMVRVIGRIEENDLFATVQGENSINWGIPKHFFTAERPSRELWTPIAPIWMIITLIIMLAGVWAHYFYAVFQLFLIKYNSKGKNK
jgi:hypothetical protein